MSRVISIRPTSNTASDTANIKSAIDSLTVERGSGRPGTIILEPGTFYIDESLVFGEYWTEGTKVCPPRMTGVPHVTLVWRGGETTDPMIRYNFPWDGCDVYLSSMRLVCRDSVNEGNCRGIHVQHARYGHEIRNIEVRQARQVGIDLIDCWGSAARNLFAYYCSGIGMRLVQFNSGILDSIFVKRTYESDFPPVDDDTVPYSVYEEEPYVQTTEAGRAGLIMKDGNCVVGNNICCEGNYYTTTPEIGFDFYRDVQFNAVRFEGSAVTEDLIYVKGGCRNIHITNPLCEEDKAKSVVRATSYDTGILVSGGMCPVSDGILICDGGDHSGHRVENVYTSRQYNPDLTVPLDKWIVEENNPTMSGKITADSSHSVSIPWGRPV